MQLLLIRHALPEMVTAAGARADPALTEEGRTQARRLPAALASYPIARIVSSPQRRALETATPLAEAHNLHINQHAGLAEYDCDHDHYIPFHEAKARAPQAYARIRAGEFPKSIDVDAFRARVLESVGHVIEESRHEDTVAVFGHGGVINVILQDALGLDRPLVFPIEYVSVTRMLVSRSGERRVASVNETGHVRDMLGR